MVFSQTASICFFSYDHDLCFIAFSGREPAFTSLENALASGLEIGGRLCWPPMPLSHGPAQHTREKQNGLGVEDWDFPPNPNQRRGACLAVSIRCFATAIIVSGAAAARPGEIASSVIGRFA
jgi:hypothetical protein